MTMWMVAGLLALAFGVRVGWALANKQSVVSAAMMVALGSLALVAALNWQPLALLIDTALHWPNVSFALMQVALIACAAGACVMVTTAASGRSPTAMRRLAVVQYAAAAVIAAISLALFFSADQQPVMSPMEFLRRNVDSPQTSLRWLAPLLYALLALTVALWVGARHSSRTRRGRALFVFTAGIALIVSAGAVVVSHAVTTVGLFSVQAALTQLAVAMVVVAIGSLLPTVEDQFGARRELWLVEPLLQELTRRQPDAGVGVRPRGPLAFRVAERLSRISDALFVEATRALADGRATAAAAVAVSAHRPAVTPTEQARRVATWIAAARHDAFPGLSWLRQPESQSDREWILAVAQQYRALAARAGPAFTSAGRPAMASARGRQPGREAGPAA